jgi:hypothetical protein
MNPTPGNDYFVGSQQALSDKVAVCGITSTRSAIVLLCRRQVFHNSHAATSFAK